eukprot:363794-Chlamydomonas_euryale.AAC.11
MVASEVMEAVDGERGLICWVVDGRMTEYECLPSCPTCSSSLRCRPCNFFLLALLHTGIVGWDPSSVTLSESPSQPLSEPLLQSHRRSSAAPVPSIGKCGLPNLRVKESGLQRVEPTRVCLSGGRQWGMRARSDPQCKLGTSHACHTFGTTECQRCRPHRMAGPCQLAMSPTLQRTHLQT